MNNNFNNQNQYNNPYYNQNQQQHPNQQQNQNNPSRSSYVGYQRPNFNTPSNQSNYQNQFARGNYDQYGRPIRTPYESPYPRPSVDNNRFNQNQFRNDNQYNIPNDEQVRRENQYNRPSDNQSRLRDSNYLGYQKPNYNIPSNVNQPNYPNQYGFNPFKAQDNTYQSPVKEPVDNSFLRQYLKSNPFFHDNKKNDFGQLYLDDFFIRVRNKEFSVDELMKNVAYSEERKLKYIKKTLKAWKKEYKQKKKEVVKVTKHTQEITGDVVCKKVKLKHRITLAVFLTIILIFGFAQGNLWDSLSNNNFFYRVQDTLNNFFEATVWARVLVNLTVYSIVGVFAFSLLLKFIIRDYRKYCAKAKSTFREKKHRLERNFSSKYRKVKRHCYKRCKDEDYTKKLDMMYIGVEEDDLEMMNKINSIYTESIARVKRLKPILFFSKWFLILSSYLGSFIIILCVIIEVLRKVVF
ncbi:MAG: hypothetical protein ACOX4W_03395 [Bacilli bacterium]|jgi:hypothetical protein